MTRSAKVRSSTIGFGFLLISQILGSGGSHLTIIAATEVSDTSSRTMRGSNAGAIVTGAGQGTFGADLDGDGAVDGSYFGVAVHGVDSGRRSSVAGHFICAMWGNTHFLGLTLMGVEGIVTSAETDARHRTVRLKGIGTVDLGMGPSGFHTDVPFEVRVREGGPGVGSIKLSVIGQFDGVPGDTELGNGNYDLPVEKVLSGHIRIP